MKEQFERVINVLGEESLGILGNSTVMVVGLGGVGSYSVEALCRSGVGTLILADFDRVELSNLNRQIEADHSTLGTPKTEALKERCGKINPECKIVTRQLYVSEENIEQLFDVDADFVIDAIDSMEGKIALWKYCQNKGIDFIASMGMARRMRPEDVFVTRLNRTEKDPMAKKLRYLARQQQLDMNIRVVISKEEPLKAEDSSILGSMIFVPATAGLICAREAINCLLGEK